MNEFDIFMEALDRPDPVGQAAYLDQACGDDGALRRRIMQLLACHRRDAPLLDRQPAELLEALSEGGASAEAGPSAVVPAPRDDLIGTVIAGRYTLIDVLGEGGMGTVYLARQTEPVQRDVALKVIKAGMDTRTVLARFEAERQALALMSHPGIARIYDGGVTAAGHPFFVMEYVRGEPITRFCDSRRLTPPARLELLVAVCRAVQHAHQKGVIHRDLKPTNVLVTEVDDRPTPKVIDFGLAKATGGWPTDQSLADTRLIVGTPEYMSPEQADPSSHDLDTRTDVYALGTILYELLAGFPPLDAKQFPRESVLEMLRRLREVDPPRPSERLSRSGALPDIAQKRGTHPARLRLLLRGEIDWVVMKALEKDRSRRYDSPASLALDLQRYLAGEAVSAVPPSAGYRLRKFLRKHRGPVGAAALLLLALVLGLVGTSWGMWRAEGTRAEEARQRQAERWERYRSNLVAAASALHIHNVAAARDALEAAPPEHRNWEWQYFYHQLDTADAVLHGPARSRYRRLSADGSQAVLLGEDRRAYPVDLRARTVGGPLALEGDVQEVDLSPDGKTLAGVRTDHTVVLWDLPGNRPRAVLGGRAEENSPLLFSPDGSRLAAVLHDRTIRVWDSATGQQLLVLRGHEARVQHLTFSPDGGRLASAGRDFTVRLWDAHDGRPLAVLAGHDADVARAFFSPRGDRVLSCERFPGNVGRLWDAATGKLLAVLRGHANEVLSVAFSPDGGRIATGSFDQTARLWDGRTGGPLTTLGGHNGWVVHVAFSPDGRRLASASQDQSVRLWDATSGAPLAVLHGHTSECGEVRWADDGATLVVGAADGSVRLWDAPRVEHHGVLRGHGNFVYDVAFHPDGRRVASASWDNTVRLWEASTGRPLKVLRHPGKSAVTAVAFHPDGKLLASAGREDCVRLWDVDAGQEVGRFPVPGNDQVDACVAFSRRGDLLACGGSDCAVHLWRIPPALAGGQRLNGDGQRGEEAVLRGHEAPVLAVAFGPDGTWLASAASGVDPTVRIWDLARKEPVRILQGDDHGQSVHALVLTRDGRYLASGSASGTVRLWDTTTWQLVATLAQGTNVYGLAFTPDGTRLACACANNTVRLWDVATHQAVCDLQGHDAYAHQVAFSPDGTRLVSCSGDFTVRVWDSLSPQERAAREPAAGHR